MALVPTRTAVAHLARRAGFGATEAELDDLVAIGYEAAVERYVDGLALPDAAADALPAPTFDRTAYETVRDGSDRGEAGWPVVSCGPSERRS